VEADGGMNVLVTVDDDAVMAALYAVRKETNQGVKEGLRQGVVRHGLPRSKELSPGGHVAAALSAGATTRKAYLQMKVVRGDEALHEFGGVRRDVILPKRAQAVMTPHGPRAAVRGPRRYRAQRFMQRAVEQTRPDVLREAEKAIVELHERHGLQVV
jgi:hypothetical protein